MHAVIENLKDQVNEIKASQQQHFDQQHVMSISLEARMVVLEQGLFSARMKKVEELVDHVEAANDAFGVKSADLEGYINKVEGKHPAI